MLKPKMFQVIKFNAYYIASSYTYDNTAMLDLHSSRFHLEWSKR